MDTFISNSQPPVVGSEKPQTSQLTHQNMIPDEKSSTHPLEPQTPRPSMPLFHNTYPDVTAGPVFTLGHDDASHIVDDAYTKEKL